jgi:hypothetical protein
VSSKQATISEELSGIHPHHCLFRLVLKMSSSVLIPPCSSPRCPLERPCTYLVKLLC